MTLSASSVLHYGSARNGPTPIVGGKPVHTRSSAGRVTDQRGVLHAPVINTPRFGWDAIYGDKDAPTALSDRRPTLLLEMARTNPLLYSTDLSNAAWTKTNATITTGIDDPAGGTSACTVTATAADGACYQRLADAASIVRANSVWLRRRTGTGNIYVLNALGSATAVPFTSTVWTRVRAALGAASILRYMGIQIVTNGDAIDFYNGQQEDASFNTSDIPTAASAVTRSSDSMYWGFPFPPQGMMLYYRFVEAGSCSLGSYVTGIANVSAGAPKIEIYGNGTSYTARHDNGVSAVTAVGGGAPVLDNTVELLLILYPTGSIELVTSVNGAAVSTSGASATLALATAWSDLRLWLNSISTVAVGANRFAEAKVVKYADVVGATAQARMDELRAFELNAAGGVLS